MPELAEVETPTTAGFVDRGYNYEKKRKRMEAEEEEIRKLEAEARGEKSTDEEQQPEEEATEEEKADTEVKEETLSAEEKSFKKRYGDLRRHMQEKEKEWDEKFKAFEKRLEKESIIPPKSDEDIEEWAKEYPDIAGVVETIAAKKAQFEKKAISIGLPGNEAEILPKMIEIDLVPDMITDQTSAHDELDGYIPRGIQFEKVDHFRKADPNKYASESFRSMKDHCEAIIELQRRGAIAFDYGNNLRGQAKKAGLSNAFDFPGFIPEYIRPLFCEGKGPFRWVALSGDPEDIYKTDNAVLEMFPDDTVLSNWINMARDQIEFQGLPSRICWLGYGQRARFGMKLNEMVASGELKAPIVIGRDHLDCGLVASPSRETESMKDGSDAVADWPLLNALLSTASGCTWVSIHQGGGVGMGLSIHSGQVICVDGSEEMSIRAERVLTNDPATGIIRHADAGYKDAIDNAAKWGVDIPSLK